ncbi:MAG TPA: RagB/SusD family nutrient uptake outer membrane protein, partial [Gemmatimonadaceae bacterium]|nr:RagB/SusD family nutrient uptake outer membrane protein [Gemmatimonadaceae bacterium]
ARAFNPPKPLASLTTDDLLRERLFEFVAEMKRRQDMIRFGHYTDAREFKGQREAYRVLFPVPATQIQSNGKLTQNPGY